MKLVPENTKKMVEKILPYLWVYVKKRKKIKLKNEETCYSEGKAQILVGTLLGAAEQSEYRSLFERNGFYPTRLTVSEEDLPELTEKEKKEIFENCASLFTPYPDITKYKTIQPSDIVSEALSLEDDYSFRKALTYLNIGSDLINEVEEIKKEEHRKQELKLEKELFQQLPVSTINFLETASKIRTEMIGNFENGSLSDQELLKYDDSYLVPLSLLLAIFEYEGNDCEEVKSYFKSKNITLDSIRKALNNISRPYIGEIRSNLESIAELYKRYVTAGVNENKPEETIEVADILNNVLDRDFTGVVLVDGIFEKCGTSTKEFKDIKTEIEEEMARKKVEEELNYAKNFYKELKRDTKDFVNFTTQTYQLLLRKMEEGKHNQEILNCEDDADTLALYIASHFYNTDFETFFVDNGVTFEKVMGLLNISISREEIEQEKLNQKVAVDRFKRFVTSGVNSNKRSENILINDVAHNLCNRSFNNSMIMENVFEEIRRDIDLPADFSSVLEKHFQEKEERRKKQLIQAFFKDKDPKIYDYLEKTCKAYKTLEYLDVDRKVEEDDLVLLSLLYAVFMSEGEPEKLYEQIGLTQSRLDSYFSINFNRYLRGELDIDLIVNKIVPYINQTYEEETQKELTVEEITENIFNAKRPKSLQINRMLDRFNLTYDSFTDFTKIREELKKKQEEEKKNEEVSNLLTGCAGNRRDVLKMSTRIFRVLEDTESEHLKKLSREEKINLSLLLSILKSKKEETNKYFDKYDIREESIMNLLDFPEDFKQKVNETKFNAEVFLNYFKRFGRESSSQSATSYELLKELFEKNSPFLKEVMASLGVDYEVLKTEIITNRDFEETLSIDDRSTLLEAMQTKELSPQNTTDIVMYGNDLSKHTTFINNQCPELVLKSYEDSATEGIQEVLSNIYEKTQVPTRPQTFFEKLMGVQVEAKEEVKINGRAISELKSVVSNYITPLYEDIRTFDSLVKYLGIYRKKVNEHQEKAESKLTLLREELKNTSEEDFEKILRLQTYVKAIEAKRDSFVLTDQLVKQYIYKAYLVMQNDLVTLTGLEMSRDALIPLLEAEVVLGNGIMNQTSGAKVTESIVNLLGEVVKKNAVGIEASLEAVKATGIPEAQLSRISQDVTNYLGQLSTTTNPNTITLEALPLQTPQDTEDNKVYMYGEKPKA